MICCLIVITINYCFGAFTFVTRFIDFPIYTLQKYCLFQDYFFSHAHARLFFVRTLLYIRKKQVSQRI